MQIQSSEVPEIHYRPYNLPKNLPAIAFVGNNWVPLSNLDHMHFHNCLEIGICHSGFGSLYVENQIFPFHPGDICLIPSNTPHMTVRSTEDSHWEYFAFDPQLLFPENLWAQLKSKDTLTDYSPTFSNILSSKINQELAPLIRSIFAEFSVPKPFYEYSLKGLLIYLCTKLTAMDSQKDCPDIKNLDFSIRPALVIIHQDYGQKLSCAELADACHLSETHFRRVFKNITALSPLEYLNRFRIRKSCILLFEHTYSIHEIALLSGFPTLSSYNRNFQKVLGLSPTQWIKQQAHLTDVHQILSLDTPEVSSIFQF